MAKSTFFRYLPARLKPLAKPAVWIPLTVIALAGVLAWEYANHPDWFRSEPLTTLTPNSQLTPEEEARLSEIDTLDVLLNGARVPKGTAEVTSQINPDAPALETKADAVPSDESALAGSFDAYPIPGANTLGTTQTPSSSRSSLYSGASASSSVRRSSSSVPSAEGTRFIFGNGLINLDGPATNSALSEALIRRDASRAEALSTAPAEDELNPSIPNSGAFSSGQTFSTQAPPAATAVPGAFIRTTPEMSPPVGTTGYQMPATSSLPAFNVAPQQPTRSLYSAPPGPSPAALSTFYTSPSSVQPDQGRAINPRR